MRLWFGVCLRWRMCLMSDPSLPALPVSNVSFHSSRLPADWSVWSRCYCLFQRFSFKRQRAFWGCAHISSLPLPFLLFLPFSPLCSPFQVFPGVCESLSSPSSSFQVKTGGSKQPGSFPLLFIHFLVFFVWLLSLYLSVSPNWVERNPWSTILKEGSQLWCIFTRKHAAFMDLAYCMYTDIVARKQILWLKHTCFITQQTLTPIHTQTRGWNAKHKIKLQLMRERLHIWDTKVMTLGYFSRDSEILANWSFAQIYSSNADTLTISILS